MFAPIGTTATSASALSDTRRQGLELERRQQIGRDLGLRVNAAWRRARFAADAFDGQDIARVPKRALALCADWRPAAGQSLDAGVQWVSCQTPDFVNLCRMPFYAVADLRYACTWGRAELAFGIANLADHNCCTQAVNCAASVTRGIYPEAGRTITASLQYRF